MNTVYPRKVSSSPSKLCKHQHSNSIRKEDFYSFREHVSRIFKPKTRHSSRARSVKLSPELISSGRLLLRVFTLCSPRAPGPLIQLHHSETPPTQPSARPSPS
eukprot:g68612.t1